jgi:hypothetical protein
LLLAVKMFFGLLDTEPGAGSISDAEDADPAADSESVVHGRPVMDAAPVAAVSSMRLARALPAGRGGERDEVSAVADRLPAARAAAGALEAGRVVTRDTLAEQLRKDGHDGDCQKFRG